VALGSTRNHRLLLEELSTLLRVDMVEEKKTLGEETAIEARGESGIKLAEGRGTVLGKGKGDRAR